MNTQKLIELALAEDLGTRGDVTTAALVAPDAMATAHFVNRKVGVVAGLELIDQVFATFGAVVDIQHHMKDGAVVAARTKISTITGPTAALLTAERVALNFICHLSGIATATHELQDKIKHTRAKVCDTRKTTPGYRALEKYAVVCGGGTNHRMGLYDMMMFKDNHLAGLNGDIVAAVAKARAFAPDLPIAVEVEDLDHLRVVLAAKVDRIMLDNMAVPMMREAVKIVNGVTAVEATGGVNTDTIVEIAETGVDFISVGAITHSVRALDIGLDFA